MSLLSSRIDANFFLVAAETLEAYDAVNLCEQRIIAAAANVFTRVDFRPALAVQNGAAGYELAVRALRTKAFRFGVTAVLRGTYPFLRREELEIQT